MHKQIHHVSYNTQKPQLLRCTNFQKIDKSTSEKDTVVWSEFQEAVAQLILAKCSLQHVPCRSAGIQRQWEDLIV